MCVSLEYFISFASPSRWNSTVTCLFYHQVLNVFMTMPLNTRNGIYENTLVKANGLLLGFGSQRFFQFCGSRSESRSGRIGIIFLPDRNRYPGPADPDPHSDQDPDLNPFQPNVYCTDKLYFFQKFSIRCQNNENYDSYDTDEIDKKMLTDIAVNKK